MWVIERFRKDHHQTDEFECGDERLDSWLKRSAVPWTKQGFSAVYVAVARGSEVVLGYYTLSTHHVVYKDLPRKDKRGVPSVDIPAVLLGRLAVDRSVQRRSLGTCLLMNAMARTVFVADSDDGALGIRLFEVHAYESARDFYLRHGLRPLQDDRDHLFLSLKEIRKLQTDGLLPAL